MKRRRNTILIIVSIAIIATLGFVLFKISNHSENSTGKGIKIETRDLESITLVNNQVGRGKIITKAEDIKAICDVINSIDMAIIENWAGIFERVGGPSYTFQFNYSSGTTKVVGYYDGSHLIMDEMAYRIDSIEPEKFWPLDYTTHKWDYKKNQFETTDSNT